MDVNATQQQGKEALQRLAQQLRTSLKSWRGKTRRRSRRMENLWLLCWLLKDLGWVLLCGPIAWPAAIAAILLQMHDVVQQFESSPLAEFAHSLATLGWLCGSSVWMTAQLLFEPVVHKSRASPWYSGSIFAANADHYFWGVFLMQAIDIASIMGLLLFYAVRLHGDSGLLKSFLPDGSSSTPSSSGDVSRQWKATWDEDAAAAEPDAPQGLVFGMMTPELYSKIFIVPWILKDLFWCHQRFIPSIICMLLVTVLMADNLFLFKKWKNLAVLLWTTGTAVWLSNDLIMHEEENWPLLLSILSLAVGTCIMSGVLVARPPFGSDHREIGAKEEHDVLL